MANVPEEDVRQLLNTWFLRDDNAVPPTFVLQRISSIIPDYLSESPDARKTAKDEWFSVNRRMHTALAEAASQVQGLSEDRVQAYTRSVSHTEVVRGLENVDPSRVLWFRRVISDINSEHVLQSDDKMLPRFKDKTGDDQKDEESSSLLGGLQESMSSQIAKSNLFEYEVTWQPHKGIDPQENDKHKAYLGQLCHEAETHLSEMIEKSLDQKRRLVSGNPLFREVLQHVVFLKEKCKMFHGRNATLEHVRSYLKNTSSSPLVIHGESGCGKTSLVAMSAL